MKDENPSKRYQLSEFKDSKIQSVFHFFKGIQRSVVEVIYLGLHFQAMIISGGMGDRGDEVISPSGNVSCSLPSSGRMYHTHDKSLICGGYPGEGQEQDWWLWNCPTCKTCLQLTSSGWVYTSHNIFDRHTSYFFLFRVLI